MAYEPIAVDTRKGEQFAPQFLKVNPNARIPAMEDDGLVLCESLAINLYIAKKYGGALGPKDLAALLGDGCASSRTPGQHRHQRPEPGAEPRHDHHEQGEDPGQGDEHDGGMHDERV